MVKVVVNNGQYKITIPKDIAESKGWSSNTKLTFVEDIDGNIILKEINTEKIDKTDKNDSEENGGGKK